MIWLDTLLAFFKPGPPVYDGQNGNGYQPASNSIPVPTPPTPKPAPPAIEKTVATPAVASPAWYPLCEPLTKVSETCYLRAYPDPASPLGAALQKAGLWNLYLAGTASIPSSMSGLVGAPWTCGWGATGDGIEQGTIWTQLRADARLTADLIRFAAAVDSLMNLPLLLQQKTALVDFTFNLGSGNLQTSTLLRLLNTGDYAGAADQFARWNLAANKVMPGLVTRRERERSLFLTRAWK